MSSEPYLDFRGGEPGGCCYGFVVFGGDGPEPRRVGFTVQLTGTPADHLWQGNWALCSRSDFITAAELLTSKGILTSGRPVAVFDAEGEWMLAAADHIRQWHRAGGEREARA